MKYFKYTLYIALLAMVSIACEVNSERFPVDTDELQDNDNTGGFLRVIDSETSGTTFDLLNLGTQEFVLTLEADDAEQGGQVESVEFFIGYQDNSVNTAGGDIPEDSDEEVRSEPFRTVPASAFSINDESGLPRATITFTSEELFNELGLEESDVGVGAAVRLRWTLNLDNGQSFSAENSGNNITGGSFFNSPFAQNIPQAVALPEGTFLGTYMFEQVGGPVAGGVIGGFGDGILFGASLTGEVEFEEDGDNPLNGRVFNPEEGGYLDAIGFATSTGPFRVAFTLDPATGTNFTTLVGQFGTGLACATGIVLAAPDDLSAQGSYDAEDDSSFTLTIVDDKTNDCGLGAQPITFEFTKVGGDDGDDSDG